MLHEIYTRIDEALSRHLADSAAPIDSIDLDAYYPAFCSGEMKLPQLEAYHGPLPDDLVTFTEARAAFNKHKPTQGCVMHYIDDKRFMCVYRNPVKYIPVYRAYGTTLGPDLSLYARAPEEEKRLNVFRNHLLALIWQHCGITVIPNVTWAEPYSYAYCFEPYPMHSVVAINSIGLRHDPVSHFFWARGYQEAMKRLEPTAIIRYGPKMRLDQMGISRFYDNPHLTRMRDHK